MESFKNKTTRTLCTLLLVYLFVYKCKPSHGFKLGLTSRHAKEEYHAWKSSASLSVKNTEDLRDNKTKEEYPAWKSSIILSETFPQHKPFISKKSINFSFLSETNPSW